MLEQLRNIIFKRDHQLSLACFAVCLCLPACYLKGASKPLYGVDLFVFGWMGPLTGYYAWLANPIYLIGIALRLAKSFQGSFVASVIGLPLALSFLLHKELLVLEMGNIFPRTITAYSLGYWVWLMAFIVLVAGSAIHKKDAQTADMQKNIPARNQ